VPLDPRAARFLKLLAAASGEAQAETAEDRRRSLTALAETAAGPPVEAEVRDVAVAGPAGPIPIRRYKTPAHRAPAQPGGAVLFVHGGGWVAGSLDTHDGFCRRLAAASGAEVLAVDYRLAPEHPFPAGLEDVSAALAWACSEESGLDPAGLVLAGDSAGGTLAAAACLQAPVGARPARLLLVCPILDLVAETPSRRAFSDGYFLSRATMARDLEDYLPAGADPADPRLSPLRTDDLSAAPPTRVHVAEFDPFRDEGLAFVERLRAAGVDAHARLHPGLIHYFYALAGAIPAAEAAVAAIGADVRAALGL
jgi:acetyl esterase/lipase